MSSRQIRSDRALKGKRKPLPIKRLFAILETSNLMSPSDCPEALNYLNKCREDSNSTMKGNGYSVNEVIEKRAADIQQASYMFYSHLMDRAGKAVSLHSND